MNATLNTQRHHHTGNLEAYITGEGAQRGRWMMLLCLLNYSPPCVMTNHCSDTAFCAAASVSADVPLLKRLFFASKHCPMTTHRPDRETLLVAVHGGGMMSSKI